MSSKVVSMSIPTDLLKGLDLVADHFSISRSALVSALLHPVLPQYVEICGSSFATPATQPKRYRGSSRDDIIKALEVLRGGIGEVQGDLFEK